MRGQCSKCAKWIKITPLSLRRRPPHPCAERPKLARRCRERPKLPKLCCPEKNLACYGDEVIWFKHTVQNFAQFCNNLGSIKAHNWVSTISTSARIVNFELPWSYLPTHRNYPVYTCRILGFLNRDLLHSSFHKIEIQNVSFLFPKFRSFCCFVGERGWRSKGFHHQRLHPQSGETKYLPLSSKTLDRELDSSQIHL